MAHRLYTLQGGPDFNEAYELFKDMFTCISERTWHTEILPEADYNLEGAAAGVEDQAISMVDQPADETLAVRGAKNL